MSSTRLLPIGEVAETTGIAVSAVRYYADIGVISSAARVGGKRRFDPATIEATFCSSITFQLMNFSMSG